MAEDTDKRAAIHRQVIALLVLGAVLAVLMAGAIAMRQGVFDRTARVYFLADTAAGISPGIAVRLSGIRIGSVTEMALQPDLKVKVTLAIEEVHFPALRRDAHAEWFKEQLQAAIIELQPGKAGDALPRDDPRVTHSRRKTLTEVANDLRGRLAPILDDVKQLSGSVAEHKGDIAAALANANAATQALATTTQELRGLMTNARVQVAALGGQAQSAMGQTQAALAKVNQSLSRVDTLVGTADKGLAAVNERLPVLLNQTGQALDQINGVVRDVRAVSGAASAAIPSLLRSAVPLMEDGREVVGGVKASWPVRALVAPPPPLLLPLDSHDATALNESFKR
jgi:phospholipid/cholesterol/gamma-HCH transport system substrate-binding protein